MVFIVMFISDLLGIAILHSRKITAYKQTIVCVVSTNHSRFLVPVCKQLSNPCATDNKFIDVAWQQ